MANIKRVVIESPYAGRCGPGWPWPISAIVKFIDRKRNEWYLNRCLRHSAMRGEAPFASHAIYTRRGVLRDWIKPERDLGIEMGFVWGDLAALRVFYVDRGMTKGMELGMARARQLGQPCIVRRLKEVEMPVIAIDSRRKKSRKDLP